MKRGACDPGMRVCKHLHYVFVIMAVFLILPFFNLKAQEKQTLYEKIARAELIILGTIIEDDARYALVTVEEVLKGRHDEKSINVSFRKENFERQQGEAKIKFTNGEKAILLLEPAKKPSGEIKKNLFALMGRTEGIIKISEESANLFVEAVRRFAKIQSVKSQNQIWEEQKSLLKEKNRFMIEAGLQEVIKFRIGASSMIPTLLEFVRGNNPQFRILAEIILKQLLEDEAKRNVRLDGREEVIRELIQKARGDDTPSVRIEAIRALTISRAEEYYELFVAISENDESQDVRYEAQKALYEIRLERNERK